MFCYVIIRIMARHISTLWPWECDLLTVKQLAEIKDIPVPTLQSRIRARADLPPDMAVYFAMMKPRYQYKPRQRKTIDHDLHAKLNRLWV